MATGTGTPRKATTRRAASKATPAKAAPAKAPEAEAEEETRATERYSFEMTYVPAEDRVGAKTRQGHTVKNVRSEKFTPPADSGVQGQLYFPVGTRRVKVTFLSE